MSRTLHFSIKKEKSNFTKGELEKIYDVCVFYNSKELLKDINKTLNSKLKKLWTCENFWVGLGSYYPNWHANPQWTSETGWKAINKREKELENKGLSYYDVLKTMEDENLIINGIPKTNKLSGFVKTQGNEFNSMLVLQALITISKRLPAVTIEISDEGEYLMCPLTIKKGLALPVVEDLVDSIRDYSFRMILSEGYEGNALDKLDIPEFSYDFGSDIRIKNSYGDMSRYINDKLRNLKDVNDVLNKFRKRDNDFYFFNLKQRKPEDWFKPTLFTRYVDITNFVNYKMSPGTLMDGFHGEAFGLTDKDGESESYKAIAKIQNLLSGTGIGKENLSILGT